MASGPDPAATGEASFEAPGGGRGGRARSVVIGVALLVAGAGVVVLGESPPGTDDIGVEADPTEEPDASREALQDAADEALEGPIEEEPVQEPVDEPGEGPAGGRDDGARGDRESSDPGSVRPRGETPQRSDADLADLDTPAGTLVVSGSKAIAVVDLASGEVVERREDPSPDRSRKIDGLAIVDDRIVQTRGDEVRLHPLDLSEEPAVLDVDGPQVFVAPDDTVWVGAGGVIGDSSPRQRWTPVDPVTATAGDPVDLPVHAHVRGATDEGLAVVRAGRTFLISGPGQTPVALDHGDLLHAGTGGLLWHVCTTELVCGLEATSTDVEAPPDPTAGETLEGWRIDGAPPAQLSEDGSSAILVSTGIGGLALGAVDLTDGTTSTLDLDGLAGRPVISSDGAWVAAQAGSLTLWAPDHDLQVRPPVDVGEPAGVALR